MQAIFGIIFHFIGGFASGSFYIPYKKVKGWSWESYWIVGGIFSWLFVPVISAWLTVPGFVDILKNTSTSTLFWTYFLGAMWGVGGLTFGLAMRYLGMSLGMSVALGFCSAFGALIPPIYQDIVSDDPTGSLSHMLSTSGGLVVLLGVAVCLVGIAICGKAGVRKEAELSTEQKQESVKEFDLKKGLLVAVFSGIMSACMSFAITAGHDISNASEAAGANPLFRNNTTFIVVMLGGLHQRLHWRLICHALR
ncbi:MAG: rhamnose/proton symporter RhaT [Pedobacter sp.]|nr:MAG: rhamnose/proton symporter RhaT [Pedobacter sp.]